MAERRYQVVFYVAILIAAMGTYGVYRVLEATRANNRIAMAPVVVANEDMADGITVTRSNVSTKPWPAQTIPPGAYASVDSVVGRVTRVPVFRGEPMVPGRLAPAGTGGGLEVKIGPGKRAMSVKINDVNGISGLLQPNSRVDVLVTIRDESNSEARGRSVAKLFMSNMRVLSVGARVQRADDDNRGAASSTATLEVTPEEAERLAVAQNQGSIQLVLRGYGDPDSIRTKGATSTDVLAQLREGQTVTVTPPVQPPPKPRKPPVEKPRPPEPVVIAPPPLPAPKPRSDSATVTVYRAGKPSQQKFEKGDTTAASQPTTP